MTTHNDYDSRGLIGASLLIDREVLTHSLKEKDIKVLLHNDYELQEKVQRRYAPTKSLRDCGRYAIQNGQAPGCVVMYASAKKVGFSGIQTCGNHLCSVCSDKKNRENQKRLEGYINKALANDILSYMVTLTKPRSNDLTESRSKMTEAYNRMLQELKRLGLQVLDIRSWDFTMCLSEKARGGKYHGHLHNILFFLPSKRLDHLRNQLPKIIKRLWARLMRNRGIEINPEAQDIQIIDNDLEKEVIADYLVKTSKSTEGLSYEIVSKRKKARARDTFSYFEIMELIAQGDHRFIPLYQEFTEWHKGKRTIKWAKGIHDFFKDLSAPEIMETEQEEEQPKTISLEVSLPLYDMLYSNRVRGLSLRCLQGQLNGSFSKSSEILKHMAQISIDLRNSLLNSEDQKSSMKEIFDLWLRVSRAEAKI